MNVSFAFAMSCNESIMAYYKCQAQVEGGKIQFKDRLKIILDNDMIVVYFGCFITDSNQILRAIKAVHAHFNQLFMCILFFMYE